MTDIARLGFSANTGDLKKAKADLDALVPSATKAEAATDKFNRAAAGVTAGTKGASAGIRSFDAAATGAAGTTDRLSKTALSASTAMGTVGKAAVGASSGINNLVTATTRANTGFAAADAHVEAYRASLAKLPAAAQGAQSSLNRLGAAANDNINRLQSTPGNIAAQFQDIGVTAAAGMSPMLIALQQGTQLSSAMAGGVGNLLAGFRQLFSVTTILTIGLVGAVAAGLQMVDWMSLAKTLLHGLADAMEEFAVVAAYAGAVLAIAFAPQIITWIATMTVQIGGVLVGALVKATTAMVAFALANPFAAIVLAIGLVIGAMILLNDTFGGVFTDAIAWVKKAANFIIGALVGAFNAVKAVWKQLPAAIGDYVIQAANWVIKTLENMVNRSILIVNAMTAQLPFGLGDDLKMGNVSFGELDNPLAGAADAVNEAVSAEMGKAKGVDYVGGIVEGIQSAAGWAANKLRGFADTLGLSPDDKKKAGAKKGGMSELEKIAKAYEDLIAATEKRIKALQVETTALGMTEAAARLYRNEQDLIAQALDKNIPLTDKVRQKLSELAQTLTNAEIGKEVAEMTKAFNDQQRVLTDQTALIGLTGREYEYTRIYQDLFNDAIARGIPISDAYNQTLKSRAALLADMTAGNTEASFVANATKAHEENMMVLRREAGELNLTGAALEAYRIETDLLLSAKRQNIELGPRDIELIRQQAQEYSVAAEQIRKTREEVEFFRDTYRGFFDSMIQGLREGQSVWEAFGNAVMSVVNRIIDRLLTMDGGVLDKLVSLGGSLLGLAAPQGRLVGDVNSTMAANSDIFAKGGAFGGAGQIHQFAKGGAFTNGIYDSPTMFKFAKGGAFGQMGEAGPEAVMPLKRGPDGSLGVQMHGPQTVRVEIGVNDDRFNAYTDQRVGAGIEATAPTVANAGAQVAQSRMAAMRRRSIT